MSDTLVSLRRQIAGAGDLESVVRSMKALAAASIGQYERSVKALTDYYRTVELGLVVSLRKQGGTAHLFEPGQRRQRPTKTVGAIVFGSDQGLVGQFNDVLADFAAKTLNALPGEKRVWAVGDRIHDRLTDAGLPPKKIFAVPTSVNTITPLVGQIVVESEKHRGQGDVGQLYLFHNSPRSGASYEPVSQRLLPLDAQWHSGLRISPGRRRICPRLSATRRRRWRPWFESTFSFRSSRLAPNRWPVKTRAGWPRCNGQRKTSTTWSQT